MKIVTCAGRVHFEEIVMLVGNVIMSINSNFVVVSTVGNGCVYTNGSTVFVVNGADFESVLVSSNKSRLLTGVTRSSLSHHRCLRKHAGSTVWVWAILRVDGGEGDAVLVILSQVEMTREPGLDATMFSNKFNELSAFIFVGVIQPAASVDDVVLLQNTQSRSIGRCVGENKQLPTIFGRMSLDSFFEPFQLFGINGNLVRGVFGITEHSRRQSHQEGLVCNLTTELGRWLAMNSQEHLQVGGIGVKLVDTFQVMVASHNFVGDTKRI
mmetsp:Transcript_28266/g.50084  ORF Transcript_28266/g.50084 Transcript_28266/m.50084 type:complete len:268 (-) Transcript_28266:230-1033(-)